MKIETFETTLTGKIKTRQIEMHKFVPPTTIPRNSGRVYKAVNRPQYVQHLYQVFENNEFLAYERKAKTNAVIQRELLLKFNRNTQLRYRFKCYKYSIGLFRTRFNKQTLFSAQPKPYFMSFQYDDCGYIVYGKNQNARYLTFEECYQRCIEFQIADPRFVPQEYIVEIRNRQTEGEQDWLKWIVPDEDTLKRLRTKLGLKDLYNSVRFQIGWTREDTPITD